MDIVDVHIYQGQWHWPLRNGTLADTLAVMDRYGMTQGVAMPVNGIAYDFVEANADLAEELAQQQRVFGYVMINGNYVDESIEQLHTHLPSEQFVGVKMHPSYHRIRVDDPGMEPIINVIAEYGAPFMVHTSSTPLASVANALPVARRHPDLPIILSHMGRDAWELAIDIAAQADNLYLDPCCSFPDAGKIERTVDRLGAERLLYGSAMMENHPDFTIGMIEDAGLTQGDQRLIYHGNARRLFGLPQP